MNTLKNHLKNINGCHFIRFLVRLLYFFAALWGGYLILKNANWCFGDDHEFLRSTAIGKIEPASQHILYGRFSPLQHYDYNLLTFFSFGKSAFAHYFWVMISFVLLTWFWMKISLRICGQTLKLYGVRLFLSFICYLLLLYNHSFFYVFLEIIYPERMILLLLAVFVYFYLSALKKDEKYKYALAFLAAVYMSYMKEPFSGAFFLFALSHLVFLHRNLSDTKKLFYMGLVFNFFIHIALYYFLIYRITTHFYNGGGRNPLGYIENIYSIFLQQPFLILIFILGIIRAIKILFYKDYKHFCFDSLLFLAIAYTCAFFILKLNLAYYFLPSVFLGYIVTFYWISYICSSYRFGPILLVIICFAPVFIDFNLTHVQYLAIQDERISFIPIMSGILRGQGKNFKIYGKKSGNFNDQLLDWQRGVLNTVINYLSDTEDKNYVIITDNIKDLSDGNFILISDYSNMTAEEIKEFQEYLNKNNLSECVHRWGLSIYVRTTNG